jgi:hypothetical protein
MEDKISTFCPCYRLPMFELATLHLCQYCFLHASIPGGLICTEHVVLWPECPNQNVGEYNHASHKQCELQQ